MLCCLPACLLQEPELPKAEACWPKAFWAFMKTKKFMNVRVSTLSADGAAMFCTSAEANPGSCLTVKGVPFTLLDATAQMRMLQKYWGLRHSHPVIAAWLANHTASELL